MKSKIPIKKKCEWCGKDFIAYKVTTRFCCKQCNSYAYKDKLRNQRIREAQDSILVQEQNEITSKEYLSPKETAMLLSVDRVTVYRYLWDGLLTLMKPSLIKSDIRKKELLLPSSTRHQKSCRSMASASRGCTRLPRARLFRKCFSVASLIGARNI